MANVRLRTALLALSVVTLPAIGASQALASPVYSQGFETNTTDWAGVTRVASGTNGVTAASGSWYGQATGDGSSYNYWGGKYASTGYAPGSFVPYTTSLDVYLNVDGAFNNGTIFDIDSSITTSSGSFLRDFIFNAGFFNDATGPGAGTNRFVISAGNNSQPGSAYAKDPGHDPIAISTSGWYTFQDDFTDNAGVLSVTMSILASGGGLVHQWTLSNPADLIGGVGGSDYGWIDTNTFPFLAIDNSSLTTAAVAVPAPPTGVLFASGLGLLALLVRFRKKSAAAAAA